MNFPLPRDGEFYLVDAGYPNVKGYLALYGNQRYHLEEFRSGQLPQNAQEKFNQTHSSLRCVIERTFGVWKERWHILDHMPSYEFKHQLDIVCASMSMHNFIRKIAITDQKFEMSDSNPEHVPCEDDNTRDRASNRIIEEHDDATMGEL